MNTQIVPGSIGSLATQGKKSIAESFISADVIVIVDTSGSMGDKDSRNGLSRYEVACQELTQLQTNLPGKIAVIGFSSDTEFYPGGIPTFQASGTDMAKVLQFVKVADLPGMKFILISDGEPDNPGRTLSIAGGFQNHIDVIYVGSELRPYGRDFLNKLAAATGGKAVTASCANRLAENVQHLLVSGSKNAKN